VSRVAPFDAEGLWLKARLFMNRSLDDDTEFEEAAFWACSALELLGKAALSRVSPSLIAQPNDDGTSLMIASGLVDDFDGFMSVQAKTVWSRCSRAFPQFNKGDAHEISLGRNAYIHSASLGFDVIPAAAWWPKFWALATVLIAHCDSTLEEFVGPTRAAAAEKHLETNRANLQRKLRSLLENARLRLRLSQSDSMTRQVRQEWSRFAPLAWMYSEDVECPACEGVALIGGDEIDEREVHDMYAEHDEAAGVRLTIPTSGLSCDTCHLELDDLDLISAAGVALTFVVAGSLADVADLYGEEYNNE